MWNSRIILNGNVTVNGNINYITSNESVYKCEVPDERAEISLVKKPPKKPDTPSETVKEKRSCLWSAVNCFFILLKNWL